MNTCAKCKHSENTKHAYNKINGKYLYHEWLICVPPYNLLPIAWVDNDCMCNYPSCPEKPHNCSVFSSK
jgi:hypothetical protein